MEKCPQRHGSAAIDYSQKQKLGTSPGKLSLTSHWLSEKCHDAQYLPLFNCVGYLGAFRQDHAMQVCRNCPASNNPTGLLAASPPFCDKGCFLRILVLSSLLGHA